MAGGKTGARVFLSALLVLTVAGCGALRPQQAEAPLDNFPAEEIFRKGEVSLETSKKPTEAIRLFSEVERLTPIPPMPSAR